MSYISPFNSTVQIFSRYQPWLHALRSTQLPIHDGPSIYVVDLSFQMGFSFNWDSLGISGLSRFRKNERWDIEVSALNLAIALSYCLTASNNPNALPKENQRYLRKAFSELVPELGLFAVPDNDLYSDEARWFMTAQKYLSQCVHRCGLRLRSDDPISHIPSIAANISGAIAAVKTLETVRSSVPSGDLLTPLYGPPTLQGDDQVKVIAEADTRVPINRDAKMTTVDQSSLRDRKSPYLFDLLDTEIDHPKTQFARSDFDRWRVYCVEAARQLRIPQFGIEDLLPTAETANHTVHLLGDLEASLEQLVPGRRKWLAVEGVTRNDFDAYWSAPTWVREFLLLLPRRQFELEMQSGIDAGLEERAALVKAALFIPVYAVAPSEAGNNASYLPIELFERVRRHFASVDDSWYSSFMASQNLLFAADYVRQVIQRGDL